MHTAIEIRRAVASDADGIAHVHIQAWREAYAHLLQEETLASLQKKPRADRWRDIIGNDATSVWFALDQRHAYLWMAADNPRAHAFYRRNGFRHDGATETKTPCRTSRGSDQTEAITLGDHRGGPISIRLSVT